MSGMKPWEFYETFVVGNHTDWQNEPYSVRLAFNLAVAAFHLADHYFRYFEKQNPDFVRRHGKDDDGLRSVQAALIKKQPYFKVIRDMANAYKHLYTRASCSIASGGAIEYVEFDGNKIAPDSDDGNYKIVIHHRDGRITKFSEAIEGVMRMWDEILYADPQPAI